jgi:magnesium-transporting ATPase (P-type)
VCFKGSSVDEECLLETARDLGVCWFQNRDSEGIELRIAEKVKRFEIVKVLEFTAERRAMSIVVKDPEDP